MVGVDLLGLCIDAAAGGAESVEIWRRQRRTLERLPSQLADALFRRLLCRRLLYPSLLEVFQHCVEEVDLRGENCVDAEWMAYLGAYRYMRVLNLAGCRGVGNSALWSITGMSTLKELDLSRCSRITDAGVEHLLSISNLQKLCVSGTKLTSEGIMRLSNLVNLRFLDLGGLPVTDETLKSLQVLTQLEYLDAWGSKISNQGAMMLDVFPRLSYVNLAWTNVKRLPILPAIACLNLSNCTLHSIFDGNDTAKAPLSKLFVHGTTFFDVDVAFSCPNISYLSVLDMSCSPIYNFKFLANMTLLEHLDLSSCQITDDLVDSVASAGSNLRDLNLSNTKVTSRAICILAGNVPTLESLPLSQTCIDDSSLQYLSMMPSLRVIDLSKTSIKGFIYTEGDNADRTLSLNLLQNLDRLENLNLEETQVRDETLHPVGTLRGLKQLYLKNDFLSDTSLHTLSCLENLTFLEFQGAVLTNQGLNSFRAPEKLLELDLRGCWLLNKDGVASFCETFPHIRVKHESVQTFPVDQSKHLNSSLVNGRIPESKLKSKVKMPAPPQCKVRNDQFIDERIKYSRDELLELQFLPLSDICANLCPVLPKMLSRESE